MELIILIHLFDIRSGIPLLFSVCFKIQYFFRSTYTNNIIEIIGNIKKQNHEIQKILQDTKHVQKDINALSGQIDRSFTVSDEMVFVVSKFLIKNLIALFYILAC